MTHSAVMSLMLLILSTVSLNKLNLAIEESLLLDLALKLDTNFSFFAMICLVSACVLLYSKYYMIYFPNTTRFRLLTLTFVMSMIILVTAENTMMLFLGWDGLGVSSYFLVILYLNYRSQNSGMITVMSNRVGDCLMMLFIVTTLYSKNMSLTQTWMVCTVTIVLVVAMFTKSAQMPFSTWLPAAMAAPTPISALVHSSTLVTAGCFILIQFIDQIDKLSTFKAVLATSTITIIIAGIASMMETDLKKIVALSTLSQMSLVFLCTSMNLKSLALLHLISHAVFKSLLFLNVGSVIHTSLNMQDLRKYHQWVSSTPTMVTSLSMCLLSLMGLTFTTGFFSKDTMFENFYKLNLALATAMMVVMTTTFTYIYCLRILKSITKIGLMKLVNLKLALNMMIPVVLLSLMAISTGKMLMTNTLSTVKFSEPLVFSSEKLNLILTLVLTLAIILSVSKWANTNSANNMISMSEMASLVTLTKKYLSYLGKFMVDKYSLELSNNSYVSNSMAMLTSPKDMKLTTASLLATMCLMVFMATLW